MDPDPEPDPDPEQDPDPYIRIREAKKHVDPVDPDPQHWNN